MRIVSVLAWALVLGLSPTVADSVILRNQEPTEIFYWWPLDQLPISESPSALWGAGIPHRILPGERRSVVTGTVGLAGVFVDPGVNVLSDQTLVGSWVKATSLPTGGTIVLTSDVWRGAANGLFQGLIYQWPLQRQTHQLDGDPRDWSDTPPVLSWGPDFVSHPNVSAGLNPGLVSLTVLWEPDGFWFLAEFARPLISSSADSGSLVLKSPDEWWELPWKNGDGTLWKGQGSAGLERLGRVSLGEKTLEGWIPRDRLSSQEIQEWKTTTASVYLVFLKGSESERAEMGTLALGSLP